MIARGRLWPILGLLALVLLGVAACGQRAEEPVATRQERTDLQDRERDTRAPEAQATEEEAEAGAEAEEADRIEADPIAALQQGGCGACHVIPGVPGAQGTLGPDLSAIGKVAAERLKDPDYTGQATNPEEYIRESITNPKAYIVKDCPAGPCSDMMPTIPYSEEELEAIVEYLSSLPDGARAETKPLEEVLEALQAPPLTDEELRTAQQIYFNRCAGCHGVLRKGATGPPLTPDRTLPKGTAALAAIIYNGTPRGMPDWGKQGVLTREETELMAKFIQHEPPEPPELPLAKMLDSWKLLVPPDRRPTAPQHDRDWQNFFSVTLRDIGKVAIVDGDTYEVVSTVDTGFAVHISRMSASGRYVYTIGRDGKVTLIDLWMEKPDKVAEVQVCYDARSVEVSKYEGFEDKYAVVGCYWPPHFVILDGATLEPFKIVSTRSYTYDTEEYHPEPRVASIVASQARPQWVINVKETGQVWLVDYSDPNNPTIKMLEAELFLHDGGWALAWEGTEPRGPSPYFLVAANMKNKIVVVDTVEEEIEAIIETGNKPHPGRGANWVHPEYGPVWATVHLGEGKIAVIGADPEGHPQYAWKVVKEIELPGGGSLFIKTHPKSRWIWVDFTLNPDEKLQRSVCVIDKSTLEIAKCWEVADYGRAVHFEYNKQGTQVWVSVWGRKGVPGKEGEIVIYDDKTLEEVARIKDGIVTPTGKFNVYNTVHDIY